MASALGERTNGEGGDAGRQRRQRPGRGVGGAAHGRHLALRDGGDHVGDQVGLRREIAVDGAGGDIGALGDGGDLHRLHAALAGQRQCRIQDRLLASGDPTDHVLRAAIGHAWSEW
jgi:hypothetical protein